LARRTDEVGDAYLRVIVESSARAGLADDVRDLFPNAVDVIVAGGEREAQTPERGPLNRLRDAPRELFNAYLKEQDIDDPRVVKLFQELLEEEYAPDPA
jgi:exonuclease SbcD